MNEWIWGQVEYKIQEEFLTGYPNNILIRYQYFPIFGNE